MLIIPLFAAEDCRLHDLRGWKYLGSVTPDTYPQELEILTWLISVRSGPGSPLPPHTTYCPIVPAGIFETLQVRTDRRVPHFYPVACYGRPFVRLFVSWFDPAQFPAHAPAFRRMLPRVWL